MSAVAAFQYRTYAAMRLAAASSETEEEKKEPESRGSGGGGGGDGGDGGDGKKKKKKNAGKANKKPQAPKASDSSSSSSSSSSTPIPKGLECPPSAARPVIGTDKLYMDDSSLYRHEGASLVSCTLLDDPLAADTDAFGGRWSGDEHKGRWLVVLDRTIFHPQGGGQPTDLGFIRGGGGGSCAFRVAMVKEDRATGVVEHVGSFEAGDAAALRAAAGGGEKQQLLELEIDGAWRHSCARIHSAGHALDVAMAALGYTIRPTKGFHFPDGPYVEYEAASAAERLSSEAKDALPAALTAKMAELSAASAADPASVGDTVVAWLGKDAANDLLQRFNGTGVDAPMFPSPDSLVRLTRLAGGWIPCGGTHVASVAAIGPVTVTRAKAKKNTLKVSYELEGMVSFPAGYAASAAT